MVGGVKQMSAKEIRQLPNEVVELMTKISPTPLQAVTKAIKEGRPY